MKHLNKLLNIKDTELNFSSINFDKNFNPGLSLKKLRKEFNISQTRIYDGNDISQSHVSSIEQGNRYPDVDTLLIYSDVLGVSYFELLKAILKDYKEFLILEAKKVDDFIEQSQREIVNTSQNSSSKRRIIRRNSYY
jgi:transcriptional regulator with XRE-family HTH domain